MRSTLFDHIAGMTERDRLVAELAVRVALHAETDSGLAAALGLGDSKPLKDAVTKFEIQLSAQSPTLSSLLASTTKSKCCT